MPKFCPNCGENISDKIKFCPSCGANINSYIATIGENKTEKTLLVKSTPNVKKIERNFTNEIIICVSVVVLGLVILWALNFIGVETLFNQQLTISKIAHICSYPDAELLFGLSLHQKCDYYRNIDGWGNLFGYVFIITGFVSSFVILYQHRKEFFN